MPIILRGRITAEGKIELIDPLPEGFGTDQSVSIRIGEQPMVYETTNEYGDRVVVDEVGGTETPVEPLTTEELLNSDLIGLWEDRRDEIGESAAWVRNLRRQQRERRASWHGRHLS
jgi:hypothetical protein